MRTLSILLAAFALAGCQTVAYRPVPLPLLSRPALTPVTASEVQCLGPGTYTTLVERERALKAWGLQYEAEVKVNNQAAGERQPKEH